jgi:hypothetical protein
MYAMGLEDDDDASHRWRHANGVTIRHASFEQGTAHIALNQNLSLQGKPTR